jgi:O-antigen/teichoic acid export membrane protein
MSVVRRIVKNTSALFLAQIVSSAVSLIFGVVIARILGDTVFGKFAFALAFTEMFSIFSALGYNTLLIREVSRDKNQVDRYVNNIFFFRVLFSLVLYLLIIITINLMQYPDDTKIAVYLIGIFQLFESLANVFKVTFRAFEKMEYEAAIIIAVHLLSFAIVMTALYLGYGLLTVSLVYAFIGIMSFLFSFLLCRKKILKIHWDLDFTFLKKTIGAALSLSMLAIFALIYVKIDTVMLSIMKGDAVVGWYNAAYYLVQGFKPLPQLVMGALFPLMSYSFVSAKDQLKNIFERAFRYLLILGLPMAIGITLLSDKIIYLLYGPTFQNSIIALQILAWDVLLVFLYGCISFLLVSIDRQHQMAILAGCTALINIILNIILIPTYSYIGSACATIAAESFLLIAYIYLSGRYFHFLPLHRLMIKPLIAAGLMGGFVYLFHNQNIFLVILVAMVIYFTVMFAIKGFTKDDISLLKSILRKDNSG